MTDQADAEFERIIAKLSAAEADESCAKIGKSLRAYFAATGKPATKPGPHVSRKNRWQYRIPDHAQ